MSRKGWIYIGFFSVLIGVFYFGLREFVPEFRSKDNSPVINYVRSFSFLNQDGQTVTNSDIAGKVVVVEYFFTTCKGICPQMNTNMRQVYDALKDEKDFLILSHTCQPEVDSVPVMKKYADSMQVDTKRWVFLTGRKDSLYYMARNSYAIDDPQNNLQSIEDDFLHTQFWALVNKKGEVKKVYDGLKENEVKALIKRAKLLLKD
jgi:protein SCO1